MPLPLDPVQWVRYNAGMALVRVSRVSAAAELAHRRLADYYWASGVWPSLLDGTAARFCRVSSRRWPAVLAELSGLGWRQQQQHLRHSEVHRARAEAVSYLRSTRNAGRKGAERRWRSRPAPGNPSSPGGPLADGDPNGHPIATLQGPDSDPNATPMAIQLDDKQTDRQTVHNTLNKAERSTFIVSARKKRGEEESEFLKEIGETLALWSPKSATDELLNWGGWWRNRFRENAAKARTILADLAGMIREGRVTGNPGAAAVDLWGRLP